MSETSLYRRHRPQTFDQVVGQEHVVRTLRNAVERDRVHHAYLFVGSRGTGKTSVAKILARSLNCVDGPTVTPCGTCESCVTIAAGTSLDVIEMDAASNRSVDDIRELRERVGYAPAAGRWKVYILDEAHMLTREAWNAFLKTLEEPPPNTAFILATTEPHKVMATIVDRCQRFDFQRPSLEQLAVVLRRTADAEGIEIDDAAIAAIARAAAGSFRDALGTLDQLVSYGGKEVSTEDVLAVLGVADAELILAAADAIAAGDGRAALEVSERLASSGHDVSQFGRDLLAHLRELVVIRTLGELPERVTVTGAEPERLRAQAGAISDLALARAIDALSAALAAIREGDEPRMTVELAVLRAARPSLDPSREALAQRLERVESALEGVRAGAGHRPPEATLRRGRERDAVASSPAEPPAGDVPHPPTDSAEHPPGDVPRPPTDSAEPPAGDVPRPPTDSAEHPPGDVPRPPGDSEETKNEGSGAPPAALADALDLERLSGMWPAVIDQLRGSGEELLSHVLAAARPVAVNVEEAVLEVGFPASAQFNKRKAEAAEARDRFAEAVRAIVGERLRPVFVLLEGDEAGEERTELSEEEVLELVRREFDAEDVEAEPKGAAEPEAKAKEA
ncbi:MAG: DNA polymerase III subunit gamma/tau [Solirubrobacterales bacterium]